MGWPKETLPVVSNFTPTFFFLTGGFPETFPPETIAEIAAFLLQRSLFSFL